MMEEYGCQKIKVITGSLLRYLKRKEIIIWKEDILHLAILFPAMLPAVLQKKDVMQVMEWVHQNRRCIWILPMLLNVMVRLKQVNNLWIILMKRQSLSLEEK